MTRARTGQTESAYWGERDTARFLGLAPITLKVWRRKGKPSLPFYRFGSRVMYRADEVRAWDEAQRVER